MPFYNRRYRNFNSRSNNRRYNKNRRYHNSTRSLFLAKKALSMINAERKYQDITIFQTVSTTMTAIQLTNLTQGTTTTTRVGNQVKWVSFLIRFSLVVGSNANQGSQFRMILVQDKQTNGAIYTNAAIMENSNDPQSPLEKDSAFRFRILWDRMITLSDNVAGRMIVGGKKFIKLRNIRTRYAGNTGTITDNISNSLSLFLISDEPTDVPEFTARVRLRYIDN